MQTSNENRKPYFRHAQIVKFARLLDMLYRPAELAAEIDVTPDTVYRSYLPAGAPNERDSKGSIWIHGLAFREWANELIKSKKHKRAPMPEGMAWCMRCNKAVEMINPKPKTINRYLELMQSKCPSCGGTVNRARGRNQTQAHKQKGARKHDQSSKLA